MEFILELLSCSDIFVSWLFNGVWATEEYLAWLEAAAPNQAVYITMIYAYKILLWLFITGVSVVDFLARGLIGISSMLMDSPGYSEASVLNGEIMSGTVAPFPESFILPYFYILKSIVAILQSVAGVLLKFSEVKIIPICIGAVIYLIFIVLAIKLWGHFYKKLQ